MEGRARLDATVRSGATEPPCFASLNSLAVLSQTVRPWQEGDKVWVSWTQTFNINMTKELLKTINFHKITLRLWDTKDKVSKKVRYYRLKPSVFSEDTGSFGKSRILCFI